MKNLVISDLKFHPSFQPVVADRIWKAWWQAKGTPHQEILNRVQSNVGMTEGIPFALVAHEGKAFIGTVSVIQTDVALLPTLSPWVAALWVDEGWRGRGIATKLIMASLSPLGRFYNEVFLCAKPELVDFYKKLGWSQIKKDIGPEKLVVFSRQPQGVRLTK